MSVVLTQHGACDPAFRPSEQAGIDIVASLMNAIEQRPDHPAIVEPDETLSYRRFGAKIFELARFVEREVQPAGAIGILSPPLAQYWIAVFACLAARRPYVALDIRHPAARNADIIRTAAPVAVIAPADYDLAHEVIPATSRRFDSEVADAPYSVPPVWPMPLQPDQPAAISFTSGSTGRPKGIANNEAALLRRVEQYIDAAQLTADDRFLTLSSPCTIAGTREGLTALLLGATQHMANVRDGGLRGVVRLIQDAGISVLNAVPSVLRALIADQPDIAHALRTLRILRVGGETLFWSDLRLLREALPEDCRILAAYSSTEAIGTQWFVPPDIRPRGPFVPVGYPAPGVSASIVDESGLAAKTGEVGELVLRSASIALGLWERGALRACANSPGSSSPAARELRTGDLASVDETGLFTIMGRMDRQVKINGVRVEPAEIEAALRDMSEIVDAAVLAERTGTMTSLTAFVVFSIGTTPSIGRVRARLRAALPGPMRPSRIVPAHAIPRLPSGKLDVAALTALSRETDTAAIASIQGEARNQATPNVGTKVRAAWRAVLGDRSLADGLSFEEAGGDSLKLLQLVLRLETIVRHRMPLDLFDMEIRLDDVIRTVADQLLEVDGTGSSDRRPLIFLLPGLDGDEPRLAAFRADLSKEFRFHVVEYPDWTATAASGQGFELSVASTFSQIVSCQPDGPIWLAGYSYGGDIGFAVAFRLIAHGRVVAFFGILDTDLHHLETDANMFGRNLLHRRWRSVFQEMAAEGPGTGLAFLLAKCAQDVFGLEHMARLERLWRPLLPRRSEFAFDRRLRRISRLRAQWRWHLDTIYTPIAVPAVLFRSDEHGKDAPADLNWRTRCRNLSVVHVEGDHRSMLAAPYRAELCRRFAEAAARPEQLRGSSDSALETAVHVQES